MHHAASREGTVMRRLSAVIALSGRRTAVVTNGCGLQRIGNGNRRDPTRCDRRQDLYRQRNQNDRKKSL